MRLRKALLMSIVASAAILTPAATAVSHDIVYSIVNNSTTPAQPGATVSGSNSMSTSAVFEGDLFVSCDALDYSRVHKDATQKVTCRSPSRTTHTLSYRAYTGVSSFHTGTATFNCNAGETMTLTFTGSGASITYSPSCSASTDSDTDDPS